MFFSRKPKKIPIIKELLFANYHYQFRHFQKWEDLQRLSYEDLEGKVRAELFGLTKLNNIKTSMMGMYFFDLATNLSLNKWHHRVVYLTITMRWS